jgi:hypothetical protein
VTTRRLSPVGGRSFRKTLKAAQLSPDSTPRELRTASSRSCRRGASSELIAKLVGHATTSTTERV